MNKNFYGIRAIFAAALMVSGIITVSAEGSENILKNPEFSNRGEFWEMRYKKLENSIEKYNGKDVVRLELAENKGKGNNVLKQTLIQPKGGVYEYSVDVLPSRIFWVAQVVVFWQGDDGKPVYCPKNLKQGKSPKPGQIVGEVTIPEGKKVVHFAVEISDPKAEGHILICNPRMALKEQ